MIKHPPRQRPHPKAQPALCRMFGYMEKQLRMMGVKDIHPKNALPTVMAEFNAQAHGRKILAENIPCLRKDGTIFYADINSVSIPIDNKVYSEPGHGTVFNIYLPALGATVKTKANPGKKVNYHHIRSMKNEK